jgi:hypothetical protein
MPKRMKRTSCRAATRGACGRLRTPRRQRRLAVAAHHLADDCAQFGLWPVHVGIRRVQDAAGKARVARVAGVAALLEHRRVESALGRAQRGGEAGDAAADHDEFRSIRNFCHWLLQLRHADALSELLRAGRF